LFSITFGAGISGNCRNQAIALKIPVSESMSVIGVSAHELDWVGSDPDRFAGHWEPTQFSSLVPDAEKLNIRPSTPKERV
jgi:hypothetical protein